MSDKVGGAVFALIFAVCFGSVGVFATYAIGTSLWEGYAAQDWIRVKADVLRYDSDGVSYRYSFGEKQHYGDRLGVGFMQSSEVDDAIDARLSAAVSEKKPITVFVNPDEPSKSVIDPSIPWMMMAFMTPFAFGFGGVGVGALYVLIRMFAGEKKKSATAATASAGGEVAGLWIFTFFWNVISFPIALVAVPQMLASGEWLGLLVLIFPLVGLVLLWAAVRATWRMIRRGPARLVLSNTEPRMGTPVSGHVAFGRAVKRGDHFRAVLSASLKPDEGAAVQHWKKEATVQAIEASDGTRVNFRLEVPRKLPTAAIDVEEYEDIVWRLELFHGQSREAAYAFDLELEPAPDLASNDADELENQPVPAGLPAGFEGVAALVGQERLDKLSPKQRAQMHAQVAQMTPQQREQIAKLVKAGPLIKKLVIAVVVIFIAVQVIGGIVAVVIAMNAN